MSPQGPQPPEPPQPPKSEAGVSPDATPRRLLHRQHHVDTLTRILQAGFQYGGEHQFAEAICDAIEDRHPFEPDTRRVQEPQPEETPT